MAFVVALTAVLGMATAWYLGAFTSNGRFQGLDACTLLPPPDVLAPLVPHGAREPGNSQPTTFIGWGGDLSSECKWSSVPAGQDDPFRTVRVYTRTTVRDRHTSAETTARKALATWYLGSSRNDGGRVKRVELGDQGYTVTDTMAVQIVFSHFVIYDLHAKFRISNALVDVSARTHTEPSEKDKALVLELATTIAGRLASAGPR
jgi:hypothetical protein